MDEAIPHLLKAVELSPQNPGALANLCLALFMAGRAQEAIPHAQLARDLRARLSSYEAGVGGSQDGSARTHSR